jgi:hypothetical protein
MNREEKAKRFARLHVKGAPLLLYNARDAGSARSVLGAGAKAIATSSWSVAAAQGYQDGEAIPIARRRPHQLWSNPLRQRDESASAGGQESPFLSDNH